MKNYNIKDDKLFLSKNDNKKIKPTICGNEFDSKEKRIKKELKKESKLVIME